MNVNLYNIKYATVMRNKLARRINRKVKLIRSRK
jgi:hypothetical protein